MDLSFGKYHSINDTYLRECSVVWLRPMVMVCIKDSPDMHEVCVWYDLFAQGMVL